MRNYVELYKNSEWAQKHILPPKFPDAHAVMPVNQQTDHVDQFRRLGEPHDIRHVLYLDNTVYQMDLCTVISCTISNNLLNIQHYTELII